MSSCDWVVEWAESKDFRGCPSQNTVTELTDAAHPRGPLLTVSERGSRSVSANGRRRRE
ncbi:MAG TPA: hypothetical protein VFI56_11530 [Vicinamibacterales bacterium]|nr:hypothetical protein [Vicinamibacterales bacterium]